MRKGLFYGLTAYLLWGILPIYWKLLRHVYPLEILFHRMLWSFIFVAIILTIRNRWHWFALLKRKPRYAAIFLVTATLISFNWLTYIWAVNNGFIVEASLGYFINPLINVLLGVLFLKERLRLGQTLAIILAAIGVLYLTFNYGTFPWIALILAFSFGFYGLLRKTAYLGSLEGLSVETGFLFIPALAAIIYYAKSGQAAFGQGDLTSFLLVFSGAITAIPLALFSAAARRVTLVALGLLQYIAPTLQFLIGVFLYGEPFNRSRFWGFCIIWAALCIYTTEGIVRAHRLSRTL
ncbi:EamA family transporter RarD [candidate division KSB1 bacterium]|nr:EamA family transporter RarD [candidate division KSB1 bacterium]RQW01680.1 MAG: EamA family transporter RarD [candidate division KSB1 bacterium]